MTVFSLFLLTISISTLFTTWLVRQWVVASPAQNLAQNPAQNPAQNGATAPAGNAPSGQTASSATSPAASPAADPANPPLQGQPLVHPSIAPGVGSSLVPTPAPAMAQALAQTMADQKNLTFTAPPQFQGAIVHEANLKVAKDAIALTFDDGPWHVTTNQILDILKQANVKSTFFWVGEALQNHPEIARRVVQEGHAIANHTWSHRYAFADATDIATEIEKTAQLIYEITGVRTTLFRPPGGYLDNGLSDYVRSRGHTVVMWSAAPPDTDSEMDARKLVETAVESVKPGSIILLHDGGGDRSKTVAALPSLIRALRAQGYRFVTVPELLALEANGW